MRKDEPALSKFARSRNRVATGTQVPRDRNPGATHLRHGSCDLRDTDPSRLPPGVPIQKRNWTTRLNISRDASHQSATKYWQGCSTDGRHPTAPHGTARHLIPADLRSVDCVTALPGFNCRPNNLTMPATSNNRRSDIGFPLHFFRPDSKESEITLTSAS